MSFPTRASGRWTIHFRQMQLRLFDEASLYLRPFFTIHGELIKSPVRTNNFKRTGSGTYSSRHDVRYRLR